MKFITSLIFVAALANVVSAQMTTVTLRTCTGTRTRRDIRDLTQAERDRFFEGIKKLLADGTYNTIAQKHGAGSGGFWDYAHSTPMFLPLHRCYLREFEDLLRDAIGDPNFALPYWDWSKDSQAPGKSLILTANYFGANDPTKSYNVVDGAFSAAQYRPNGNVLVRQYVKENITTFHHSSLLASILAPGKTFSAVSVDLEYGPHATVHTAIGGRNGVLSTRLSPFDPIFWLHHCFIDKLWADWQAQGTNVQKFDGASYGGSFGSINAQTIITPYGIPVSSVLKSSDVCVQYAQPKDSGTDGSVDKVKPPDSLPDSWFNNTGINKTIADTVANKTQQIATEVNKNLTNGNPIATPPTAPSPRQMSGSIPVSVISAGVNILLASMIYLVL